MPSRSSHYAACKHAPEAGPSDWITLFCIFLDTLVGKKVTNKTAFSYVVYQCEECPETKKHHVQFYFQTEKPVEWKSMKKFWAEAGYDDLHFEPANSDDQTNYDYCTKEESRLDDKPKGEHGERRTIAGKKGQGSREDIKKLKADIDSGKEWRDILDLHFGTVARHASFFRDYAEMKRSEAYKQRMISELSQSTLRPWQQEIVTLAKSATITRCVHWYWETVGNVGKSWMAKYLAITLDALVLNAMKKSDMLHLISKRLPKVCCFDMTRTTEDGSIAVVYEVIEMLQSGYFCSGKYDSTAFSFDAPHVFVFANYSAPKFNAQGKEYLSADRFLRSDGSSSIIEINAEVQQSQ